MTSEATPRRHGHWPTHLNAEKQGSQSFAEDQILCGTSASSASLRLRSVSISKRLVDKFRRLALPLVTALTVAGCVTNTPQAPRDLVATNLPFAKEINAYTQADLTNPPPRGATLFVGSSSIRLWKTLAQDFPQHRVINRGFG